MIQTRLIGEAASPIIGVLRRAAAAGEPKAELFENRDGARGDGIAGVCEADGSRQAVLRAAGVDGFDLFAQLPQRPSETAR